MVVEEHLCFGPTKLMRGTWLALPALLKGVSIPITALQSLQPIDQWSELDSRENLDQIGKFNANMLPESGT